MTFDVSVLTAGLERGADDIWFAPRRTPVSYPEHGNAACLQFEDRSFWFRHRNRCVTTLVRRFAPKGVLLDVGGGNGYVAKGLMDAGIECALLEPGLEGVLAARARGVDPVICARLEDLDEVGLARGSLGAAGMFDVLEHIEDEADALRRVHRAGKRKGGGAVAGAGAVAGEASERAAHGWRGGGIAAEERNDRAVIGSAVGDNVVAVICSGGTR